MRQVSGVVIVKLQRDAQQPQLYLRFDGVFTQNIWNLHVKRFFSKTFLLPLIIEAPNKLEI